MRRIFFLIMATAVFFTSFADNGSAASINLEHQGHDNHIEHYLPADAPEAYYDSDEMKIIIETEGFASYYTVEVLSMENTHSVIYTHINGCGDTIDVSSLCEGCYKLVITSEYNNVYIGYFNID